MRTFRALYQEHYGFVWATVRRMGVRPEAIDDAVQDAFLVAYRRWDDLPGERHRAWLYGIARRVSSNARKIERRRVRKHDALRHQHVRAVEIEARLEASAVLDRFVGTLSPADRELFVLGLAEGLTGQELASALQAKASTLYGRLQALRRRFIAEVGEGAEAAAAAARRERPRASAASWALLLPKLGLSPVVGVAGAAVVAAVAVAVGIVTPADAEPSSVRTGFAQASCACLPTMLLGARSSTRCLGLGSRRPHRRLRSPFAPPALRRKRRPTRSRRERRPMPWLPRPLWSSRSAYTYAVKSCSPLCVSSSVTEHGTPMAYSPTPW